jgi:hypothetical protein
MPDDSFAWRIRDWIATIQQFSLYGARHSCRFTRLMVEVCEHSKTHDPFNLGAVEFVSEDSPRRIEVRCSRQPVLNEKQAGAPSLFGDASTRLRSPIDATGSTVLRFKHGNGDD